MSRFGAAGPWWLALADGVFVAQHQRFVFVNAALPAMLGYAAPREFVDLAFEQVIDPRTLPLWNERFTQRVGRGAEPPRAYEVLFLMKDGTPSVTLELVATRSTFLGKPAVLGLVRDISERKRLASELEQHRNHLADLVEQRTQALRDALTDRQVADDFTRLVADNIPGGIAYLDADWCCRFVNRGYCEFLDKPADELLGEPASALFGGADATSLRRRIEVALTGEAQRFEEEEFDAGGALTKTCLVHFIPDPALVRRRERLGRRDGARRGGGPTGGGAVSAARSGRRGWQRPGARRAAGHAAKRPALSGARSERFAARRLTGRRAAPARSSAREQRGRPDQASRSIVRPGTWSG